MNLSKLRLVLDDFFCHGRFEKEVPTRFPILGEIGSTAENHA